MLQGNDIDRVLDAVGELLAANEERVSIVVIGGAALQLLGVIERATRDVDIVAVTRTPGDLHELVRPPEPLPPALESAITQVGKDFGLPEHWMNREPAGQWDVGFPEGFAERVQWRTHGGLDVGVASRLDLIFFKLEAAADRPDSNSRHFGDLVALNPSDDELERAGEWVRSKNAGPEYHDIIERVIRHVQSLR